LDVAMGQKQSMAICEEEGVIVAENNNLLCDSCMQQMILALDYNAEGQGSWKW
jgi:hypothetical protein